MTTTKHTHENETRTNNAGAAAEACCRTAADAFKAGVEANQRLFTTMANSFSETFAKAWTPMTPASFNPWATAMGSVPAAFERMTQAMNTLVDANARFASECNALLVDAMRANARTIERCGAMMVNQFTGRSGKPAQDAAREIMDECSTFGRQMIERCSKMTSEQARQVAQAMEQTLAAKA